MKRRSSSVLGPLARRAGERSTQCTGITLASPLCRIGLGHRLVDNPQDDGDEVTGFVEDAQMGSGQNTGIILDFEYCGWRLFCFADIFEPVGFASRGPPTHPGT